MKKIYKVIVTYGWMTERGMQYLNDWEFFSTKKGYKKWIDYMEECKIFTDYEKANAKVYEMKADHKGRFVAGMGEIDNFNFTTNKKAIFV